MCDNCLLLRNLPQSKNPSPAEPSVVPTLPPQSPAPFPTCSLLLFLSPFAELYIAKHTCTRTHTDCDRLRKFSDSYHIFSHIAITEDHDEDDEDEDSDYMAYVRISSILDG